MLKKERLHRICALVNEKGIIHVSDIMTELGVSDMTVRRDLEELDKAGKLIRIHGGAQSLDDSIDYELSHLEKSMIHVEEKKAIVQMAASLVKDGDTVFLGPGTTIEMLASLLTTRDIKVITNSVPVFRQFAERGLENVLLVGGTYRLRTGALVGVTAQNTVANLHCRIAFISCNGIMNSQITTSSMDEGYVQTIALNNSRCRYVLADSAKFNREDFYAYYDLHNLDGLITDLPKGSQLYDHYSQFTKLITERE